MYFILTSRLSHFVHNFSSHHVTRLHHADTEQYIYGAVDIQNIALQFHSKHNVKISCYIYLECSNWHARVSPRSAVALVLCAVPGMASSKC